MTDAKKVTIFQMNTVIYLFEVIPDSECEVHSPQTFTGSSQESSFIFTDVLKDFKVTFVPKGPRAKRPQTGGL